MTQPTTTEEAIAQVALGPESVTVGNTTVKSRSAQDLIEIDNHQKNQQVTNPFTSLFNRTAKLIPPGGG